MCSLITTHITTHKTPNLWPTPHRILIWYLLISTITVIWCHLISPWVLTASSYHYTYNTTPKSLHCGTDLGVFLNHYTHIREYKHWTPPEPGYNTSRFLSCTTKIPLPGFTPLLNHLSINNNQLIYRTNYSYYRSHLGLLTIQLALCWILNMRSPGLSWSG